MNRVKLTDIKSEGNVRQGNKNKEKTYVSMKNSIETRGVEIPVTVVEKNGSYVLLDGHQRYQISKELGLNDIPCTVMPEGTNITEHQLTANMFSVPMSPREASVSIGKMIKDKPSITRTEIADTFGKDVKWVNKAIQYNNLHKKLQTKKFQDKEYDKELLKIAGYTQHQQGMAIKALSDWDNLDPWRVLQILKSKPKYKEITNIVPIETIRKYEKKSKVKFAKTLDIFECGEDFTYNDEFLSEVFLKETEVGKLLAELPVQETLDRWANNCTILYLDTWETVKKFDERIRDKYRYEHPNCNYKLVKWNGNVRDAVVQFRVIDKNAKTDTGVVQKRSKYYGQEKKFMNAVCDLVISQLNNVNATCLDTNNANITFRWLIANGHGRDMNFNQKKIEKGMNDAEYINKMTEVWFNKLMLQNTFRECDKLFKALHMDSIRKLVNDKFKVDATFRGKVIQCFTLGNLKETLKRANVKGTKKEVVMYLTEQLKTFPFNDIWKELPHNLNIKGLPYAKEYLKS